MENFHYSDNASGYKNINFFKFFSKIKDEKDLETVMIIVEEAQKIIYNDEQIRLRGKDILWDFDTFCAEKLQNTHLSSHTKDELQKLFQKFRHNLEIAISVSSLPRYFYFRVNKILQSFKK